MRAFPEMCLADPRDNQELQPQESLGRVADLCHERALIVYTWALMPNHFHLLVRTGGAAPVRTTAEKS